MKRTMILVLTLSALLPGIAFAQAQQVGTLVYGPEVSPVPGLNGVMLLVLALLVFAVAFRVLRRRTSGPLLSILAAALVTALFSIAGGQVISDSDAIQPAYELSNPSGGSAPIYGGINNLYQNTSGVAQLILGINGSMSGCYKPASTCFEGVMLEPGESCNIQCSQPSDVRLKRDITYLAELDSGIKVYSFRYLWSDQMYVGVMAQDLLADARYADAVSVIDGGYYGVNYASLGLRMMTLDEWRNSGH